ncbi:MULTISPECIES: epoxide hydrolase family protein [Mycobacterium]|uniref:Epoxide hydrolase n=1 Tax=Mycobacterium kiyosense TaxID=2871094 RepID=A0A9P3UW25_9MYCO|nr:MULTISPECIES: epoxide hydrolase family protein [Mycobacterium]BDE15789.1 epoxide hydrolase [Mycobacterium sp. 20KCMC460]GLB80817.1 epoxide hydrolase [Mycobacterium kiyosense]GLB87445.1 epoxide hydrolase [Mycobacterium kiyosense]GLB93297.1 epoxide hydrolase [Mycobacterium kiyosense]GLB99506.1 epoxide hydrolase [Mycobacterium kiyosense]
MAEIHDLRITISEPDIADLRERLKRTRWPDAETVSDWSQGIPSSYVRELAGYWAENYDMNRLAERLNAYPNYHATLGDLGVHFLHVRSPHDGARPLILTHGWPGSVLEFLDVIGPLTEPERFGGAVEDAFHVVIPSLPGYGFSAKPTITGVGIERIADAWDELMAALGYHGYYAQGGDWGAFVTTAMGIKRPAGLLGIHVNMALASPEALAGLGELTPDEQAVGGLPAYLEQEGAYAVQQATRPQTLGYGLADSPVGQLAWITEKFYAWTDCDGHPEKAVARDVILDNVMLYWLTNTAASSARLYWESFSAISSFAEVALPSAFSLFPKEIIRVTERWLRTRFTDLRYYNAVSKGGHFAALEQPDVFVDEVRSAIRALG